MAFIIALILLSTFVANVVIGAVSNAPLVGNVTEMIVLLLASVAFVAGILQREAQDKKSK